MTDERPIEAHALIGDGRTAALVATDGTIDWLCWPRFDSPSVLAALLDEQRGGLFGIQPVGEHRARQQYVPNTNIVLTSFETATGILEISDAMIDGEHPCILRSVRCRAGEVDVVARFDPRFDFGATETIIEPKTGGGVRAQAGAFHLTVESAVPFTKADAGGEAHFTLKADEQRSFWLHAIITTAAPPTDDALDRRAEQILRATANGWRQWSDQLRYDGVYKEAVVRSALTLKLLQHRHGGFVAAPTTSVPDSKDGDNNRDHRFVWSRDASMSARALALLGYDGALKAYLDFVNATLQVSPALPVMTTLDARPVPEAQVVTQLAGHRGHPPVRVGFDASDRDLDIAGYVLDAAHLSVRLGHGLMTEAWTPLARLADDVAVAGGKSDRGTYGQVMHWVALRRAAAIAEGRGDQRFESWRAAADSLRESIENSALRGGHFSSSFESDTVEATLLLLPIYGFVQADDPRMRATTQRVRDGLETDGFVRRTTADKEASVMCGFWLAEALALSGDVDGAAKIFEKNLSVANHAGLLADAVDPSSGASRGNFPRAISHVALIQAALTIHRVACQPQQTTGK